MTIMTNEERAREAADRVTEEICGFSQRSRDDVEAATRIILTALNAATAELEAERGRLREAPAFVCGAIIAPNGSLRFIDVISDERYAWDYAFNFPDEEEIARCKKEGFRYQLMYAFTCDHRSALPELIARVERAEKALAFIRDENWAWATRETPSEAPRRVYGRWSEIARTVVPEPALTGDTPNV